MRFGPGAGSDESTESKSPGLGPDFRFIRFTRRIRCTRCGGPGGAWGGNLDLMSWGHCRFIRFIRFGPGSESNESNESKVAPRTFDSDTTSPMQVPLNLMNLMGSNAAQVLAVGSTFDALDAVAAGQALTLMMRLSLKS